MGEGFTKLFSSILRSSVWQEPAATRLVWITLLAMADRNGYVGASIPGVAVAAGVSVEDAEEAIAKFMAPDRYSRSKEHDGRRLVESDRGWTLLNYARFREMRDTEARREWDRERKRADRSGQERKRPQCPPQSAHAEAEYSADAESEGRMEGRKEGKASPVTVRKGEVRTRSTTSTQSIDEVLGDMGLGGGA